MKIKKGDLVKVISGKAAKSNTVAKVLAVYPKEQRVKLEGVAQQKRHLKPQRDPKHPEGGVIAGLGTIHVSNVMLMSEAHARPVRTGSLISDNGEKRRVARGLKIKADPV